MKQHEFDALVSLMQHIAWHESGRAINQPRAGTVAEEIMYARDILVDEED